MSALTPGEYLVTITLNTVDAVAKNAVQWHFAFIVTAPTDSVALMNLAVNFIKVNPTGQAENLRDFLSNNIDRGVGKSVAKLYNISSGLSRGSFHGTPQEIMTFALGSGSISANDIAAQNSLVLATNAPAVGILEHGGLETAPSTEAAIDQGAPDTHPARSRPLSRYRGRMFLGPWNAAAMEPGGDSIATQLLNVACHAAVDLVASSVSINAPWAVWSKADSALRAIAHGYCENKFGTQRRRREVSPVRSVWP